jgi:hypothetical protein
MMFFSRKLRKLFVGLLSIAALVSYQVQADSQIVTEVAGTTLSPEGQVVAKKIKRVFYDAPEMLYVANCESRGLIHREGGTLVKNQSGTSAQGVFQVLMRIHKPEMRKMGLSPNNTEDYLTYVRHLYDTYGMSPWADSKKCWRKYAHTQSRG